MAQEIIHIVFRYLHLLGFATVLGGLIVQIGSKKRMVSSAMLHGGATQLVTGLALFFLTLSTVNHAKVMLKLVLLAVLMTLFILQRRSDSEGSLSGRAFWIDTVLLLVIAGVAVFWRSYT